MRSLVAALTLVALNAHAAAPATGPATATVAVVKGKVVIHRAPGDVPAAAGQVLKDDDEVQVPPGGMAVLLLSNGYPVRIDEDLNLPVRDIDLRNAPPIDSVSRLNAALSPREEQELGTSLAGVQARLKGNSANSVTASAMEQMPMNGPGGVKGAPPARPIARGGFGNAAAGMGAGAAPQPAPQPAPSMEAATSTARPADASPPPPPPKPQKRDEEKVDPMGEATLGAGPAVGGLPSSDDKQVELAKPHAALPRVEKESRRAEVAPKPLTKLHADSEAGKVIAGRAFQKCLKDGFPAELPHAKVRWGAHVSGGVITQVAFEHGVAVPDACRLQLVGKAVHASEKSSSGWVWMSLP